MKEYGYMGKILIVDLSRQTFDNIDTSDYADLFLGGRGIGAKIYWDLTHPGTNPLDPENCLIFITGPATGFTGFSGCRWQICGKSPVMTPEAFSYANLGGSWGAWLKYAGFDGIVVTGKANRPVYICISSEGVIEIRDASHIWGKTTLETQDILQTQHGKGARFITTGPAGENQVTFATVMASNNSSGGSGFGAVMGSKNLKAVVINVDKKKKPLAASPEKLKILTKQAYEFKEKHWEPYPELEANGKFTPCYGCMGGPGFCNRRTYKAESGRIYRAFCQATLVYFEHALKNPAGGSEAYRLATRLCDSYSLDSAVMEPLIRWIYRCYEAGILNERETGLPFSQIGSTEFIEILVKKLSFREGFGDILSKGMLSAADYIGPESRQLLDQVGIATKAGETKDYDPRLMLANALIYATEPRRAIQLLHAVSMPLRRWVSWLNKSADAILSTEVFQDIAEKYWGSKVAADLTTYEGKAMAAKKIQDYGYAKESIILCDYMWPIHQVRDIDPEITYGTLESRILSAITGREMDEKELLMIGERVFNLQRMVFLRDGWKGREDDTILDYLHKVPLQEVYWSAECLVPGKDGEIASRKGAVIDREKFEKMKDEYYTLRGWEVNNGIPTKAKLRELGLDDIIVNNEK